MRAKKFLLSSVLTLLPLSVAPIWADEPTKESIEGIWYNAIFDHTIVLKDGILTQFFEEPYQDIPNQWKYSWVGNSSIAYGINTLEFDLVNPDLAIAILSLPIPLEVFEEQEREQERERREAAIRESFKNDPEARRLFREKIGKAEATDPSQRPPRQILPNDSQPSPLDLAKTETGETVITKMATVMTKIKIDLSTPKSNLGNAAHEPSIFGLWRNNRNGEMVAISRTRYCSFKLDDPVARSADNFGKLRLIEGNRFSILDKYDEPADHFWEFQVINRENAILSKVEGSAETATELQRPRETVLLSRVW